MRRHACWLLAAVLLLSCKRNPQRFCDAFTTASKSAATYEEALGKTDELADLEHMSGAWGSLFRGMYNAVRSDHLAMVRNEAQEQGTTFECPAFEFPAGKPAAAPVLVDPRVRGVRAMAADDGGLFLLSCGRSCAVLRWDGKALTSLADGLDVDPNVRSLALGADGVFVATKTALVSVPRAGGPVTTIVPDLEKLDAVTRDGASLYYVLDHHTVWRVPVTGGKPQVAAIALSFEVTQVIPSGKHLVLVGDPGLYVVSAELAEKDAVLDPSLRPAVSDAYTAVAVGSSVAARAGDELVLLDPASGEVTPAGVGWERVLSMVSAHDEVLGVDDGAQWPGKQRLVRWSKGQKAPAVLAAPVGFVDALAVGPKEVYWVDRWWGGLSSAKR